MGQVKTKISTPGVYDISLEEYHNVEPCTSPSISSSGLVKMSEVMGNCPARYWYESPLNPDRELKDTDALRIGRAVHTLLLEGKDAFKDRFGILPEGMDLRTNAGKAIKAEIEAAGRTMIRHAELQPISGMVAALASHPRARHVFTDGAPEKTLVFKDPDTGIFRRARPDWLPTQPLFVPDLKSAADASKFAFEKAVWEYGYHMKAANVCTAIRELGLGDPQSAYFVVQEKKAPYLVGIYALNKEALEWGEVQNREAMLQLAQCLETGDWPGYPPHVQEINLPIYAQSILKNADLSGPAAQERIAHEQPSRFTAVDHLAAG